MKKPDEENVVLAVGSALLSILGVALFVLRLRFRGVDSPARAAEPRDEPMAGRKAA